jgi:hypothetical protein
MNFLYYDDSYIYFEKNNRLAKFKIIKNKNGKHFLNPEGHYLDNEEVLYVTVNLKDLLNQKIMTQKEKEALAKAVEAIYFDDSADYSGYLWDIVRIIGGQEAADLLESDEQEAYMKYVDGLLEE